MKESHTRSLIWGTTWIKVCSHNYSTQPRFSPRCFYKLSGIPLFLSLRKFHSCSWNTHSGHTNLVHSLAHTQWAQLGTLSSWKMPGKHAQFHGQNEPSQQLQAAKARQCSLWAFNLNNLTRTRGSCCTGEHSQRTQQKLRKTHLWKLPTHRV